MNAKHDRIAYLTDLWQPAARQDQATPSETTSRIIRVLPGQTGRSERTANPDPSDPFPGHLRPFTSPSAQCPALRQAPATAGPHMAPDGQHPALTGSQRIRLSPQSLLARQS